MPIVFHCPECNQKLRIKEEFAGQRIRCRHCDEAINCPEESDLEDDDPFDDAFSVKTAEPIRAPLPLEPDDDLDAVDVRVPDRPRSEGVPAWIVVLLAVGFVLLLLCGGVIGFIAYFVNKAATVTAGTGRTIAVEPNLAAARLAHPTRLLKRGPAPQDFDNDINVPDGEKVTIRTDQGEIFGWFVKPPGDGPFPAVLHAHGGFALGQSNIDDVRPLVQAGYAVLVPAWRGENGNPGSFEFCFGEVDDAMAALDYLAARPDVDPNRLYATGHSVGGTLVMLLAEMSPRLRAVMACGGCPDMQAHTDLFSAPAFPEAPFDYNIPLEGDLRSPARHLRDLRCPLLLLYGADEDTYESQARVMQQMAPALGKPLTLEIIPGTDHFTALAPAMTKAVTFFGARP